MKPLLTAFQKKYPGIKLSSYRLNGGTNVVRVIQEHQAGKLSMDVGWANMIQVQPLVEKDLLVTMTDEWVKSMGVNPDKVLINNKWIGTYDQAPVFIYNKNLVSAADVPKSFEDLLDPKWKGGKILMTPSTIIWGQLYELWLRDKRKVKDIVARLRGQEVILASTNFSVPRRLAAGEAPIGVTFVTSAADAIKKGAPVALCPLSPTVAPTGGLYIPKGVPHPNAAKLLLGWLASEEAQLIWNKKVRRGWVTSDPESAPAAKLMIESGVKYKRVTTQKELKILLELGKTAYDIMGFTPK
ncbi:ABC transporter substrate-binding protein [Nitrospinota bacterium]